MVYRRAANRHARAMQRANILLLTAAALFLPADAHAAEIGEVPAISVDYNAAIVSDYRFRGISLSDRKPAAQLGVDLTHRSGLFAGVWTSTIADYGGSNVEIDLYGGYGGSLGGFDYGAGVYGYVYPDGRGVNYLELQSTVARTIGPVTTTFTAAYVPRQDNAAENLYLGLSGELAIIGTPFTASAGIGRETGGYDGKYDWSAGLNWTLDAFDISASYVDSNYGGATEAGRNGRAGVILSVKAMF